MRNNQPSNIISDFEESLKENNSNLLDLLSKK